MGFNQYCKSTDKSRMGNGQMVAYILHYDTPATIDSIKALHQKDPKNCCRELLKDWLETNHGVSPKNWFKLLNTRLGE